VRRSVRSSARDDIQRQFRYFLVTQDAPEAALRFLDSVEAAIAAGPDIGSPRSLPNLPGLRSWPIPNFEDIRIYYTHTAGVLSIRVLHGKRDLYRVLGKERT